MDCLHASQLPIWHFANFYMQTLVIFSMLRTDLRRISSSRKVAMFLALVGAAGWATAARARERLASNDDICRNNECVKGEESTFRGEGAESRRIA